MSHIITVHQERKNVNIEVMRRSIFVCLPIADSHHCSIMTFARRTTKCSTWFTKYHTVLPAFSARLIFAFRTLLGIAVSKFESVLNMKIDCHFFDWHLVLCSFYSLGRHCRFNARTSLIRCQFYRWH